MSGVRRMEKGCGKGGKGGVRRMGKGCGKGGKGVVRVWFGWGKGVVWVGYGWVTVGFQRTLANLTRRTNSSPSSTT